MLPRSRAVIFLQLYERVGLGGFEKGPKRIPGVEMPGVRDVGPLQHAIFVFADELVGNVLLKNEFWSLFRFCHGA